MAISTNASSANSTIVNESNQTTDNFVQNYKDMGKFNRESQDTQNKAAQNAVANDNLKTALNAQISSAKGVSY